PDGVGGPEPRNPAADGPPTQGRLRLRGATPPTGLPRVPVGASTGSLGPRTTVRMAPTASLAGGSRTAATGRPDELPPPGRHLPRARGHLTADQPAPISEGRSARADPRRRTQLRDRRSGSSTGRRRNAART